MATHVWQRVTRSPGATGTLPRVDARRYEIVGVAKESGPTVVYTFLLSREGVAPFYRIRVNTGSYLTAPVAGQIRVLTQAFEAPGAYGIHLHHATPAVSEEVLWLLLRELTPEDQFPRTT